MTETKKRPNDLLWIQAREDYLFGETIIGNGKIFLKDPPRFVYPLRCYAWKQKGMGGTEAERKCYCDVSDWYRFDPIFNKYLGHGVIIGRGVEGESMKAYDPYHPGFRTNESINIVFFPVSFVELSERDFTSALEKGVIKLQTMEEAINFVRMNEDDAVRHELKMRTILGGTTNHTLDFIWNKNKPKRNYDK